jgi:hypothetical protein
VFGNFLPIDLGRRLPVGVMLDKVFLPKAHDGKVSLGDAQLRHQGDFDFRAMTEGHAFSIEFEGEAFWCDYFCH